MTSYDLYYRTRTRYTYTIQDNTNILINNITQSIQLRYTYIVVCSCYIVQIYSVIRDISVLVRTETSSESACAEFSIVTIPISNTILNNVDRRYA